jgi:hypothetical protein
MEIFKEELVDLALIIVFQALTELMQLVAVALDIILEEEAALVAAVTAAWAKATTARQQENLGLVAAAVAAQTLTVDRMEVLA